MKKAMMIGLVMVMLAVAAASNVYAGGFASAIAKGLAGRLVGQVLDDAGKVIGAGADWAQESIDGKSNSFGGDLKYEGNENVVDRIEARDNAVVQVGAVTIQGSRFEKDVNLQTRNKSGAIIAQDESYVNVGSIGLIRSRFNGQTTIQTNTSIHGGIEAGKKSVVRVGDFTAH